MVFGFGTVQHAVTENIYLQQRVLSGFQFWICPWKF